MPWPKQFKLTHLLLAMLLIGLVLALGNAQKTVSRQRSELQAIQTLLPPKQLQIDLIVKIKGMTSRHTLSLDNANRGFTESLGEHKDGIASTGVSFSAYLVGNFEFTGGFWEEREQTKGWLVALRVSATDDTNKPQETTTITNYVVYNGERIVAFDSDDVTVVIEGQR